MPNLAAAFRQKLEAAGGEIIERTRNGIVAALPDGQRRLIATAGYRLHLDDLTTEVDTDLDPDTGTWVAKARAALPYDFRVGDVGTRRFIPRKDHPDEYVEFGRLQYYTGNWSDVPLGTYERVANRITWDRPHYAVTIALKPSTIKFDFLLKDASADYPIRWAVSLVGLSWNAGGVITSDSDAAEVAWLKAPHWEDAEGNSGPVPWDYTAGYIRFDPDLTGAVFPVTIDPDVGVDVAAGADDGYYLSTGTFNNSLIFVYAGGYNSTTDVHMWLRFDNVGIPNGATISTATIDLVGTANNADEPDLVIYCLDEDDSNAPANGTDWTADHSNHTSESASWTVTGGTSAGSTNTTSSFASAVEAVVGRGGWASGQAIGVHIDEAGTSGDDVYLAWASYENTSYDPPHLDVTYSTGGTTHSISGTTTGASATSGVLDLDLQTLSPDGDVAATGWATNPTPGQDLYAQVDEATASDTDFIDADGA